MTNLTKAADLDLSHLSATIAAELAAGLADADGIKERYELSDAQWNALKKNPAFRAMLKEALTKLHGDINASKRITMKAEIALEDSIPVLYAIAHDSQVQSMARIKAIEEMSVLAGRKGKDNQTQAGAGGGFAINIQINTGEGNAEVAIAGENALPAPEAA
jgi:hypothetical protein